MCVATWLPFNDRNMAVMTAGVDIKELGRCTAFGSEVCWCTSWESRDNCCCYNSWAHFRIWLLATHRHANKRKAFIWSELSCSMCVELHDVPEQNKRRQLLFRGYFYFSSFKAAKLVYYGNWQAENWVLWNEFLRLTVERTLSDKIWLIMELLSGGM